MQYLSIDYAFDINNIGMILVDKDFNLKIIKIKNKKRYKDIPNKYYRVFKFYYDTFSYLKEHKLLTDNKLTIIIESVYYRKNIFTYAKLFYAKEIIFTVLDILNIEYEVVNINKYNIKKEIYIPSTLAKENKHIQDAIKFYIYAITPLTFNSITTIWI